MMRQALLVAAVAAWTVEGTLTIGACRTDVDCRLLGDLRAECQVQEGESTSVKRCVCSDQLPTTEPDVSPVDEVEMQAETGETKETTTQADEAQVTYGRVSEKVPICVAKTNGQAPKLRVGVSVFYPEGDCTKVNEVFDAVKTLLALVLDGNVLALRLSCGAAATAAPTTAEPQAVVGRGAAALESTTGVSVVAQVEASPEKVVEVVDVAGALSTRLADQATDAVKAALGAPTTAGLVSGFECGADTPGLAGGAVRDASGKCQPLGCAAGYRAVEVAGDLECVMVPVPRESDDDLSDAEIAAIVLGCVGAVLVVAVIVFAARRASTPELANKEEQNEPAAGV